MSFFSIFVAQSETTFSEAGGMPSLAFEPIFDGRLDLLNHPSDLLSAMDGVHPVWGGIFLVVGGLCVINGFRWHKGLVLLLAAILGVGAGARVGDQIEGGHNVAAASLALLFAVAALPMLRFAVALFGGLAGAFLVSNAWTACDLDPDQHHFGAIMGMIGLGLLAFVSFRLVTIVFTSIIGATLVVFGGLSILLHVDALSGTVADAVESNARIVPMIVGVTALAGAVVQQGGGIKGMMATADKAAGAKPKAKPA